MAKLLNIKFNLKVFPLLALVPFFLNANKLDSLKAELARAKTDSDKVNLSFQIAFKLLNTDSIEGKKYINSAVLLSSQQKDPSYLLRTFENAGKCLLKSGFHSSASTFFNEGLKIATKEKNQTARVNFFIRLAETYMFNGLWNEGIIYYDSAIINTDSKNEKQLADLLRKKGRGFYEIGNYKKAMELYIQSQRLFEKNKIISREYCGLMHYIGSVFKRQHENKKALMYYEKELEIARILKSTHRQAEALYLCAEIYGIEGDIDRQLQLQKEALSIYKANDDKSMEVIMLGNISINYSYRKDFKTAIKYAKQALNLAKEKTEKELMAFDYRVLGDYYSQLGKHKIAFAYYDSAQIPGYDNGQLLDVLRLKKSMTFAYERMGDYKNAFKTYLEFNEIEDSLRNQDNREFLHEQEIKYGTEKKEQEIALLNVEKEKNRIEIAKKKTERNAYMIGGLLVLLLAGISVGAFINKKKSNKLLAKQNEEIQLKNRLIQEKNKDITDSIQYAKRIQQAVLPLSEVLSEFFSDSFILFRPKDIVSGDFYWFTEVNDGAIFAVADCTGHGVPGAFMSIIGHDLLNQVVLEEKIFKPSEILSMLDKRVSDTLNKKGNKQEYNDGMDIALCFFDRKNKKLYYAGANRPLLVRSGSELIELRPNKFAIGGVQDDYKKEFTQQERDLRESDIVYFFSDGYQDQFGKSGKKLKYARMKEFLSQLPVSDLSEQRVALSDFFDEWKGSQEQIDDVCVAGIRM